MDLDQDFALVDHNGVKIIRSLPIPEQFQPDLFARVGWRQHLRHQLEALRIGFVPGDAAHNHDVGLRLEISDAWYPNANVNISVEVETARTQRALLIRFNIFQPDPTPGTQAVARLLDTTQEPRIVLEPVFEPVLFRF